MADDFGISELVTLAPGFARAALCAPAGTLSIQAYSSTGT